LENREKLIKELKALGRIPESFDEALITDEKLIELSLNPSLSGNPLHLNLKDMEDRLQKQFDHAIKEHGEKNLNGIMKLPSFEVTEEDEKQLKVQARGDEKLFKELKQGETMRKFLHKVMLDPDKFAQKTLAANAESSGSVGGYTVPIEFEGAIAQLLPIYGKFRANCSIAGMSSKTLTKPQLNTGVTATWTDENVAGTVSNPTFNQITYTRHKLDIITPMTLELLQDTGSNLMGELAILVASAFGYAEDIQGFAGSGSPITGVFNTSGINTTATSTTNIGSLTYADILTAISKLTNAALPGSKFYMHRTTLFQVIAAMKDDVNRPIFAANEVPYTLFGYPVELVETFNANTITTANTPFILFGNLKYSYLRQRIGMYMRMSDTATVGGVSAFANDLMYFKTSESLDIQHEIPAAYSVITNKIS